MSLNPARWLPASSGYRVAVAALAGLAVTVVVAWWCQVRDAPMMAVDVIAGSDARLIVPARVAGQWGVAGVRQEGWAPGRTNLRYRGAAWEVLLCQSGWPMRALEFETIEQLGSRGAVASWEHRWAWIVPGRGFPAALAGQPLPMRPLWVGLLVDVAVWAAAFWPLIGGFVLVRGLARRRRGRCAHCGYPVGISPVCTECGRAVRTLPMGADPVEKP